MHLFRAFFQHEATKMLFGHKVQEMNLNKYKLSAPLADMALISGWMQKVVMVNRCGNTP